MRGSTDLCQGGTLSIKHSDTMMILQVSELHIIESSIWILRIEKNTWHILTCQLAKSSTHSGDTLQNQCCLLFVLHQPQIIPCEPRGQLAKATGRNESYSKCVSVMQLPSHCITCSHHHHHHHQMIIIIKWLSSCINIITLPCFPTKGAAHENVDLATLRMLTPSCPWHIIGIPRLDVNQKPVTVSTGLRPRREFHGRWWTESLVGFLQPLLPTRRQCRSCNLLGKNGICNSPSPPISSEGAEWTQSRKMWGELYVLIASQCQQTYDTVKNMLWGPSSAFCKGQMTFSHVSLVVCSFSSANPLLPVQYFFHGSDPHWEQHMSRLCLLHGIPCEIGTFRTLSNSLVSINSSFNHLSLCNSQELAPSTHLKMF